MKLLFFIAATIVATTAQSTTATNDTELATCVARFNTAATCVLDRVDAALANTFRVQFTACESDNLARCAALFPTTTTTTTTADPSASVDKRAAREQCLADIRPSVRAYVGECVGDEATEELDLDLVDIENANRTGMELLRLSGDILAKEAWCPGIAQCVTTLVDPATLLCDARAECFGDFDATCATLLTARASDAACECVCDRDVAVDIREDYDSCLADAGVAKPCRRPKARKGGRRAAKVNKRRRSAERRALRFVRRHFAADYCDATTATTATPTSPSGGGIVDSMFEGLLGAEGATCAATAAPAVTTA